MANGTQQQPGQGVDPAQLNLMPEEALLLQIRTSPDPVTKAVLLDELQRRRAEQGLFSSSTQAAPAVSVPDANRFTNILEYLQGRPAGGVDVTLPADTMQTIERGLGKGPVVDNSNGPLSGSETPSPQPPENAPAPPVSAPVGGGKDAPGRVGAAPKKAVPTVPQTAANVPFAHLTQPSQIIPPQDEAEFAARKQGWSEFLARDDVQTALFQFGVSMLMGSGNGRGLIPNVGASLGQAGAALQRREEGITEAEQRNIANQREEQKLENEQERIAIERRRAAAYEQMAKAQLQAALKAGTGGRAELDKDVWKDALEFTNKQFGLDTDMLAPGETFEDVNEVQYSLALQNNYLLMLQARGLSLRPPAEPTPAEIAAQLEAMPNNEERAKLLQPIAEKDEAKYKQILEELRKRRNAAKAQ